MRRTKLALLLSAALAAAPLAGCEDEAPLLSDAGAMGMARDAGAADIAATGDAGADGDGASSAAVVVECWKGTPTNHEELLNACWAETVTAVVAKPVMLPGGYKIGMPLPPPP
jgi:hypothetical protein